MLECESCFLEAFDLGKQVKHYSGEEGLDEMSIAGPTCIAAIGIESLPATLAPADAGLARHPAMARIHLVHCVGPRMRHLWQALPEARRGEWHETAAALTPRAHLLADAGDVVLVKGSKGSKVSIVVDGLRKLGQPGAGETRGRD